jgi:CPSF A subunit region
VGQLVTRFVGARMKLPPEAGRHDVALFATREGQLGVVAPLWHNDIAPRLRALQAVMATEVPHVGGLNPVAFRWVGRAAQPAGRCAEQVRRAC